MLWKEKFDYFHVKTNHGNECLSEEKLHNEKPNTERNMRSQTDSDKNFEPCLEVSILQFAQCENVHPWPSKVGKTCPKNTLPAGTFRWFCAQLVYRHQNLSWPSLIPLLLTRHDQDFVSCKETYNYLARENNAKNLVFGWK